jgi:hypothetical protein
MKGNEKQISLPGEMVTTHPVHPNGEIFLFRVVIKSSFRFSVLRHVISGDENVVSSQSPVFI